MITGENGFLYNQLNLEDSDFIFLLGSPTFDGEITLEQSKKLHEYVQSTIKIINENTTKYIIFASSTGVNDVDFNHKGSMPYTLAKLFLENYIITYCDNYCILRIGTIITKDKSKIKMMKKSRIQNRILRKEYSNIPLFDYYLDLDEFIKITKEIINERKTGIIEYKLTKYSLSDLIRITNE